MKEEESRRGGRSHNGEERRGRSQGEEGEGMLCHHLATENKLLHICEHTRYRPLEYGFSRVE